MTEKELEIYQEEMRKAIVRDDTRKLANELFLFATLFYMPHEIDSKIIEIAMEDFNRAAKAHGYFADLTFNGGTLTIKMTRHNV